MNKRHYYAGFFRNDANLSGLSRMYRGLVAFSSPQKRTSIIISLIDIDDLVQLQALSIGTARAWFKAAGVRQAQAKVDMSLRQICNISKQYRRTK